MSTKTKNYQFVKPEENEFYDINIPNANWDIADAKIKSLEDEVTETKKSVSDGKTQIAAAITLKKVSTAATATFAQMAENIKKIFSGSGNAAVTDVLAGKTFTNNDGTEYTGTMKNQGAVNQSLGINAVYTIPAGYHNGSGKVTQNIATFGAQTITPSASQQVVSTSGKYGTGNITVSAVTNLAAGNIRRKVTVGGVAGNVVQYKSMLSNRESSTSTREFKTINDKSVYLYYIEINEPSFERMTNITAVKAYDGINNCLRLGDSGIFIVNSASTSMHQFEAATLKMDTNSFLIPVPLKGTYHVGLCGYTP